MNTNIETPHIVNRIFNVSGSTLLRCSDDAQEFIKLFGEHWGTVDYDPEFFTADKKLVYEVIIPDGITEIAERAFAGCEHIISITIPKSVKRIGAFAFSDCPFLEIISIEGDDVIIDLQAFSGCDFYELRLGSIKPTDNSSLAMIIDLLGKNDYPKIVYAPYYLFLDTETSGLPLDYSAPSSNLDNWPRVVQLSWVLTDLYGQTIKVSDHIIRPDGFIISNASQRIHGISQAIAMEKGDDINAVLKELLLDLDSAEMIVGHNVEYDMKVIGAELLRNGYSDAFEGRRYFCTMKNTIDYCCLPGGRKGAKSPKLQELYSIIFGKEFENAHNALSDIEATKDCFFELLTRELIPGDRFEGSIYSPEGWILSGSRPFSNNEIEAISEAIVIPSPNGRTIRFSMKSGGVTFIPLNPGSLIGVGESVNLNEAMLETLKRENGESMYQVVYRPRYTHK